VARILVVDAHAPARSSAARTLQLEGYVVEEAVSAEQALALIHRVPPDLLVIDAALPGLDGFAMLEGLKGARPEVAEIPVVMVGGSTEPLDRIRAAIEGALVYVTKPYVAGELAAVTRAILDGGPEPAQRRRVQTEALAELARIETAQVRPDAAGLDPRAARPRLTRLEPIREVPLVTKTRPVLARELLSTRQNEIVDAVIATGSLRKAAERLHVSRTYLYASLRRIADKVGVASGPDLVRALTAGGLHDRF
jgi:DNA-binding response OmpR family regulator